MSLVVFSNNNFFYRMVSTYLVHQGFCATAEAFISQTDQSFEEEIASIKNRQSNFKTKCAQKSSTV